MAGVAILTPRLAQRLADMSEADRRRPIILRPPAPRGLNLHYEDSNNPVPVIVTGGDSLTGYTVDVYGNGLGAAATAAALMDPLNIAYADTVPADGTFKLWVLPSQLMAVGDGT